MPWCCPASGGEFNQQAAASASACRHEPCTDTPHHSASIMHAIYLSVPHQLHISSGGVMRSIHTSSFDSRLCYKPISDGKGRDSAYQLLMLRVYSGRFTLTSRICVHLCTFVSERASELLENLGFFLMILRGDILQSEILLFSRKGMDPTPPFFFSCMHHHQAVVVVWWLHYCCQCFSGSLASFVVATRLQQEIAPDGGS